MELAIQKRLCLICLQRQNHHVSKCRTLKFTENLCQRKNCYSSYTIHHQSICEAREPHTKPENKVNNDREINNKEDDTNESLSLEERLTNL
uniref:DUF1758 domain-containing protein n=1 Tax=Caenorhabditis tropicalis TaxID=1561998 RepID=A0A1I7TI78_9PELO